MFQKIRQWLKERRRQLAPTWQRYQIHRLALMIFLAIFFIASAYLTSIAKLSHVEKLQDALAKPTVIYDAKNQRAGELFSQKGTYVKFDQISPKIKNAALSVEDRNFYHEPGFSIKGIMRAALGLVRNKLLGSNVISGGGSTLTQQLAKNAYLSQEQTFTRKAKELFLSVEIERQYSKDDILTMYLNNVYFGHGIWGVEDASQAYFGVDASQLDQAQAATLAGMLQSSVLYDPIENPDASKTRRNIVLETMVENKKLSSAAAKQLKSEPLVVNQTIKDHTTYDYPWYFDAVINEAINRYGITEKDIMNRGYKIYTSMDQTDQKNLQDDYNNAGLFPANSQSASIVLDARTGGVRAVIGGREDEHIFRGFNRATQARRQPGSTIKPIVVYAPALQHGYFYDSMLPNHKMTFGNNKYSPGNAGNVETKKLPMYEALEYSYNIPAVYLLNKMGVSTGYKSAQKFGLPVTKKDKSLALALGGMNKGVSPQDMAQAFTAFADNGAYHESHFITRIEDASGKVIVNHADTSNSQIIPASVAREMASMMIGTYTNGTGSPAKPAGIQIAGKTGTTEDVVNAGADGASKDLWAIAYTPDVVVASWQGFDKDEDGQYLQAGIQYSLAPLFKRQMEQIVPNTKQTPLNTTDANTRGESGGKLFNSEKLGQLWQNTKDNLTNGWQTVSQKTGRLWDDFSARVQGTLGRY